MRLSAGPLTSETENWQTTGYSCPVERSRQFWRICIFSVFELGEASTGQTDEQTDRRTGKTRNAAY